MSKGLAVIFGGSGFIGQYVARTLVENGWRVRIACRRPHIVPHLKLAGGVGLVSLAQCNVRNRESVMGVLRDANAAVYLPGLLFERGNQTFENVHVNGPENVARSCADLGIENLVHMSALGAVSDAPSRYSRTKAEGEAVVHRDLPTARIMRPSIVFGPEDDFFNRFASLARFSPFLPAIGFGKTRFQPIHVDDLAKVMVASLDQKFAGMRFDLGGPRQYTLNDLYDLILETIDRKRLKLPMPIFAMEPAGLAIGGIFRFIPPMSWGLLGAPPLTGDQIRSLKTDNIVDPDMPNMATLGMDTLKSLEVELPSYLWVYRQGGEFHQPQAV